MISLKTLKKALLIVFPVLLYSCSDQNNQSQAPKEIISKETFTKVLTDFALAESAANLNVKKIDFRKLDSVYAFNPLKENHITRSQYDSAVDYYVRHPEEYKEIYENVLVALSELQAKRSPVKDTSAK